MKSLLVFVLAGSLFAQLAGSLKCYTCTAQISNSMCQAAKDCDGNATACRTDMMRAAGFLNFITKACSPSCEASSRDYIVAQRNVSCCEADLCNLNGARSFGSNYAKVAWALCTSLAVTFLGSGP